MTLALIDGDVLLHSSMWATTTVDQFKDNVHRSLEEWTNGAFCDDRVIALGPFSGVNYRDRVYGLYKKSVTRSKARKKKAEHFIEAKTWLYNLPDVSIAEDIEADDLLGHWASQVDDSVIVTLDKDLNQVPGPHYSPYYKNPHLFHVGTGEANLFFLQQMLQGDSIDNIPGVPGLGPVKSARLIESSERPAETVLEVYKTTFGDDWANWFLANGRLLFIQRRPNQVFNLELYQELFNASA